MSYNYESLEVTVVISGNGVLSKDIKISLGLLINYSTKFKNARSISGRSLPLQTIEFLNRVSNPKFEANLSA